jgi:hypothetical protein
LSNSPRSRQVSLVSFQNRSRTLEGVENTKRLSSSSVPTGTVSNVEGATVIGSHPGSLQSSYCALPQDREKVLTKLPVADVKGVVSTNSFDREFLKGVLGSLIDR